MKPRCPYCNAQGLKHLSINHAGFFAIVFCGQCGAIHGIIPLTVKQQPQNAPQQEPEGLSPPEETQEEVIKQTDLIAELGKVDLSQKAPYSPDNVFAYVQAMRLNPSTKYMKIAHDDGPPLCSHHKVEMEKLALPEGHKNSGRVFWVCPDENCNDWLLAE